MSSGVAARSSGRSGPVNYSGQLGLGPTQVVVDHGEGGHLASPFHLLGTSFDPLADVVLIVPPGRQPGRLHLG